MRKLIFFKKEFRIFVVIMCMNKNIYVSPLIEVYYIEMEGPVAGSVVGENGDGNEGNTEPGFGNSTNQKRSMWEALDE